MSGNIIGEAMKNPFKAIKSLPKAVYKDLILAASSHSLIGTNVFERDWDLLIILDTCRVDALQVVADEYKFLSNNTIYSTTSVGGSTLEWTANTFTDPFKREISNTGLISANGWPKKILHDGYRPDDRLPFSLIPKQWNTIHESDLGKHIPAWKRGPGRGGESDQPQAGANTVIDLAIRLGRKEKFDRIIAHLIEPHYPYIGAIEQDDNTEISKFGAYPWQYINSDGDLERLWDLYLDELRLGLDAVELLLNNFSADRVLITSDHGEAFGEFRTFGHGSGSLHPKVRWVPVLWTSATDDGSYEPQEFDRNDVNVGENLKALGYR